MADNPIVVTDSGIGGLPYLARIRDLMPEESLCYVADTAHFPYGDRSDEEVVAAVLSTAKRIQEALDPKILVVACNTASVLALDALRAMLSIPVVGVVPAVKPACAATRTGSVAVLATARTVSGAYLDDLVARHCRGCRVSRWAAGDLVRYVEEELGTKSARPLMELAAAFIEDFAAARVDSVVLGCTHFVYVAEALETALGSALREGCAVIDSRDGVARQTARVAARLREAVTIAPAASSTAVAGLPAEVGLFVTGTAFPPRYAELADRFAVRPAGVL